MSEELFRRMMRIEKTLQRLTIPECSKYKGTSAVDFTTTTLPHEGDYGFQTTDDELQVNCDGVILKTAMTAL